MPLIFKVDLQVIDRVSGTSLLTTYEAQTTDEAFKLAGKDSLAVARAGKPYRVEVRCPICGALEEFDGEACSICGYPDQERVKTFRDAQQQREKQAREQTTAPVQCPRCGSQQIMGDTRGFSAGKAVVGGLLLGPLGLLGGLAGSKKVIVRCLKCGHQWSPGAS
jgi:DNA-directed RNA polymerase subunit M/transcription elongation factor TFIIS